MSKRLKSSPPIFPSFDVSALILVHLGVKDLFRYGKVSKKWNEEITIEKWPTRYKQLTGNDFQWFQYMFLSRPDAGWNLKLVCANPSFTIPFMESLPERLVDMEGFSENSNVTPDYILDNPERDWVPSYYSENPNVTEFHVLNDTGLKIDLQAWLNNVNCTFETVTNTQLGWDKECLYCIPSITVEEYMSVPEVDPAMISEIRDIYMQDIINYPDFIDIFKALQSPCITLQDVRDYAKYFPTTAPMCANPGVPIDVIMNDPIIEISYYYLSMNPNLTGDHIGEYLGMYDPHQLALNPGFTFKDVLDYPDEEWDYRALSSKVI